MERCGIRRYDLRYGDTRPALLPRREPFVGTHHGRFGRAGTGPRRGRPAFRHPGHPARPGGMGTGTAAQDFDTLLTDVPVPDGLAGVECMISGNGGRTAVVPSFSADVNNAGRLNLLRIADWLSDGKLPAIMETMAQAAVVPRIDSAQNLRSVMLLNCSISKQDSVRLRLRGCPPGGKTHFRLEKSGTTGRNPASRYEGRGCGRADSRSGRLECRLAGRRIAPRPRPKRIIEKPNRFSGELGYLCRRFLPTQHPDDEIPSRDSALRRTDGGMFRGDASRRGLAEPEDHDLQSSLRRESFAGGARRSDPRAAAPIWSLFRRSTAAPGGRASSASTTKTS